MDNVAAIGPLERPYYLTIIFPLLFFLFCFSSFFFLILLVFLFFVFSCLFLVQSYNFHPSFCFIFRKKNLTFLFFFPLRFFFVSVQCNMLIYFLSLLFSHILSLRFQSLYFFLISSLITYLFILCAFQFLLCLYSTSFLYILSFLVCNRFFLLPHAVPSLLFPSLLTL